MVCSSVESRDEFSREQSHTLWSMEFFPAYWSRFSGVQSEPLCSAQAFLFHTVNTALPAHPGRTVRWVVGQPGNPEPFVIFRLQSLLLWVRRRSNGLKGAELLVCQLQRLNILMLKSAVFTAPAPRAITAKELCKCHFSYTTLGLSNVDKRLSCPEYLGEHLFSTSYKL